MMDKTKENKASITQEGKPKIKQSGNGDKPNKTGVKQSGKKPYKVYSQPYWKTKHKYKVGKNNKEHRRNINKKKGSSSNGFWGGERGLSLVSFMCWGGGGKRLTW